MLSCCAIVQKLSSYERVQFEYLICVCERLLNGLYRVLLVEVVGGGVCVYRMEAEGTGRKWWSERALCLQDG